MSSLTGIWRCRVCEGVNEGGRVCATCGAQVAPGEPLRAAVRTRLPSTLPPAPAPVPPTVRRRELRSMPTPEDLRRIEPEGDFSAFDGMKIVPLPGGCLILGGGRG
jgi:hypothetical protein